MMLAINRDRRDFLAGTAAIMFASTAPSGASTHAQIVSAVTFPPMPSAEDKIRVVFNFLKEMKLSILEHHLVLGFTIIEVGGTEELQGLAKEKVLDNDEYLLGRIDCILHIEHTLKTLTGSDSEEMNRIARETIPRLNDASIIETMTAGDTGLYRVVNVLGDEEPFFA